MVGVLRGPVPQPYWYFPSAVSIRVRQSSLPVAGSRQRTNSLSPVLASSAPMITSLFPATAGPLYPAPSLSVLNRSFGPPWGHCFRSPVSVDLASRFGPCHWGQSPTGGAAIDRARTVSWSDDMGRRESGTGGAGRGGRAGEERPLP